MRFVRLWACACLAAAIGSASAKVTYRVSVDPDARLLHVQMEFTSSYVNAVCLPNWAPGSYVLRPRFSAVQGLSITRTVGASQEAIAFTQDRSEWRLMAGRGESITVRYDMPMPVTDGAAHWSGPSTYFYVDGRTQEDCELYITAPREMAVAIGSRVVETINQGTTVIRRYKFPTYDVLADNPVSIGDLIIDTYHYGKTPVQIAMRGRAKAFVDRPTLIAKCKQITDTQAAFFGGFPPNIYVWHFDVSDRADGGGGLEHLSSTQIGLAAGMQVGIESVLSHEFFHLWNVKRIRSKVLGPFDYTKLPKTGALWWLEGVTDYYASLLLARSGQQTWDEFYRNLNRNYSSIRNSPNFTRVSPHESSLRVDETNNGMGNSNGYLLSYYNLGFVAGFCLDVELRKQTGGRYSIDDVTRSLWKKCKDDQPGFPEEEIRSLFLKFGGAGYAAYYDQAVHTSGGLDLPAQLAKVGLELNENSIQLASFGFEYTASASKKGLAVTLVNSEASGRIARGDVVKEINGTSVEYDTMFPILRAIQNLESKTPAGSKAVLRIQRESGAVETIEVVVGTKARRIPGVKELATVTEEAKRIRLAWMKGR